MSGWLVADGSPPGPLADDGSPEPLQEPVHAGDVIGPPRLGRPRSGPSPSPAAAACPRRTAGRSASGLTPFFSDLPIFPDRLVTGLPWYRAEPSAAVTTSRGRHVHPALVGERVGQYVALVDQPRERLAGRDVAEVVQHLVPEPGVQQVQDGVLDAADVQVDAALPGQRPAGLIQYLSLTGSANTRSLAGSG